MQDELIIYHNPNCSKSRETLAILQAGNKTPTIIDYLKNPPTEQELKKIIELLGVSPRELLRTGETAYLQENLDDLSLNGDQIIGSMCAHPILIERPIVISGGKAVIGRPPSVVLDIINPRQVG